MQINTDFPNGLVKEMDDFCGVEKTYKTRQEFIREAVRDKIKEIRAEA